MTYRWLRSDGLRSADQTVSPSPKGGTATVETGWERGPGEDFAGWQQLDVIAPSAVRGSPIVFDRVCGGGGEGPASPG